MSEFGFDIMLKEFHELKEELPLEIGNMGVRYFMSSFRDQGWDGKPWQVPQRRIPGTLAYKYPKKKDLARHERDTLIGKSGGTKTGSHEHLRAAVNNCLKSYRWEEILYTVPQPYAERHNEGLDGMPQRQFIGFSEILINQMAEHIDKRIIGVMHKVI